MADGQKLCQYWLIICYGIIKQRFREKNGRYLLAVDGEIIYLWVYFFTGFTAGNNKLKITFERKHMK